MADDQVQAAIGRSIVHDEDLGWRLGLGEYGAERTLDVGPLVVERDNDGECSHASILYRNNAECGTTRTRRSYGHAARVSGPVVTLLKHGGPAMRNARGAGVEPYFCA
jgi:hypothetical protein